MTDADGLPEEAWVEVGRFANGRTASEHALVLVAAGIDCQLASRGWGVALLVAAWHAEAARQELAAYAEDNRPDPQPPVHRHPVGDAVTGVLAYWCVMVFVYVAADHNLFGVDWYAAGEGQAGLTVGGQWWRAVTALGLHADLGHIASNLVAGSLFGFFLAEILGSGLAWLMILLAGAAGNAINALVQPASHTSIGASTAIFGAVGLLAVLAVRYRPRRWRRACAAGRRSPPASCCWPSSASRASASTSAPTSPVSWPAAVLGAAILAVGQPAPTARRQTVSAAAALVVFAGAWAIALAHGG